MRIFKSKVVACDEKMKCVRQEKMIKQRKARFGGVGGVREGKMTDPGSSGRSGCYSTLRVPEPTCCLLLSTEVNPLRSAPTRRCHNPPPPTLASCVDVCLCVCVCVSPLFFPDIPALSREALDSAAGRQDLKLHPESH